MNLLCPPSFLFLYLLEDAYLIEIVNDGYFESGCEHFVAEKTN